MNRSINLIGSALQSLLELCGRQFKWTLVPEHSISLGRNRWLVIDGALIDDFNLTHGHWEAKDIHDDLPTEIVEGLPELNAPVQV